MSNTNIVSYKLSHCIERKDCKVANARVSNFDILSPSIRSWPLKIDKHFMYMWRSD